MTDGERMAILETKVTDLTLKVTDIQTDVKAIIATLSKQPSLEQEILQLKKEILIIQTSSNLWKWLSPTLSAVLGSIVTFLVIQYLTKL